MSKIDFQSSPRASCEVGILEAVGLQAGCLWESVANRGGQPLALQFMHPILFSHLPEDSIYDVVKQEGCTFVPAFWRTCGENVTCWSALFGVTTLEMELLTFGTGRWHEIGCSISGDLFQACVETKWIWTGFSDTDVINTVHLFHVLKYLKPIFFGLNM